MFKYIKRKIQLVYESEVEFTAFDNYLIIKSKIDKKNLNKLVNACDELIEYIQDEIKLKPLFERSKESIKNLTYLISENKEMMISMLCNYILNIHKGMDIDKLIEKLDSIKEEDITSKTKSLKRESVFIYRGDAK